MQHIEIDQFSRWSVAVVESPAQAASVFYLLALLFKSLLNLSG